MCRFFSLNSDGKGKIMYSDWEARKEYLAGKRQGLPDSHTSIAYDHGYKGRAEDTLNKYEYNPLTKHFRADQLNTKDDSKQVKRFCHRLDFKAIVPQLIIKPIVNPFIDRKALRMSKEDIELLRKWDSVRASVWDSVWRSVGRSARRSVGDSVWDSVRDSVWDSVRAYVGSFFDLPGWKGITHKRGEYPFRPAVDLWERGIVPSFDGKTWRLHGYEGKVLKEISSASLKSKS